MKELKKYFSYELLIILVVLLSEALTVCFNFNWLNLITLVVWSMVLVLQIRLTKKYLGRKKRVNALKRMVRDVKDHTIDNKAIIHDVEHFLEIWEMHIQDEYNNPLN